MAKVMVKLKMFHEPHEVDEDEIPGLRAQGLLVEDGPPASSPPPPAAGDTSSDDKEPSE